MCFERLFVESGSVRQRTKRHGNKIVQKERVLRTARLEVGNCENAGGAKVARGFITLDIDETTEEEDSSPNRNHWN